MSFWGMGDLRQLLADGVKVYEREEKPLNIVMFAEVCPVSSSDNQLYCSRRDDGVV